MRQYQWLIRRLVSGALLGIMLVVMASGGLGTTSILAADNPPPETEWEKTYGGINFEEAWSVEQTTDGGYILVGQGPSFDAGDADFYLVKTDTSGNLEWEKTFGGTSVEVGFFVEQTTDDGYIIAGFTDSYGAGAADFYLVKTDASGNTEWEKTFGGYYNDFAECVAQTTDDGYIIAGRTGSYGAGANDFYLVKTDASGNLEWEKTFGGYYDDVAKSVEQTTDDGYIIAGSTDSYGAGANDFYLVKTDASGNLEWEKTFGGTSAEVGFSVEQTTDDGYIIAGSTDSYGAGAADFYLVKTDASGNMEWEETFGGSIWDTAESVVQTTDGGYIIAGYTESYGAGGNDVYLVKTNTTGLKEWEKTVGGNYHDKARSVWQTTDGGYIITGQTSSYGAGSWDAYLIKVSPEEPTVVPPVADAGGPYLVQVDCSVDLDGSASYGPDRPIVSYDWNFGDNTMGNGVLVSHTYTTVGIYDINLTVSDDIGAQSSNTTIVVVYDPDTGSATGGGWFWSAEGNLRRDIESEGKATFGFVVKYKQEVAAGNLEFQYHVGDINLKDSDITWLVVSSVSAHFQGEGTINGEGLYTFRVLAKGGDQEGGHPDEFTIKIWEGTDTEACPIYQALHAQLGGGNIIIHNN